MCFASLHKSKLLRCCLSSDRQLKSSQFLIWMLIDNCHHATTNVASRVAEQNQRTFLKPVQLSKVKSWNFCLHQKHIQLGMGLGLAQPKAQLIWAGPKNFGPNPPIKGWIWIWPGPRPNQFGLGRAGPNRPWAEKFWPKLIPIYNSNFS